MAGWVYILSNPTMPTILKVGYTEKDPISRAKELSDSTGVALPYEVEYQVYTTHPYQLEKEAHKNLANYRVNKNREFFECRYEEVVEGIRNAIKHCESSIEEFSTTSEISYKVLNDELEIKLRAKNHKKRLENLLPYISNRVKIVLHPLFPNNASEKKRILDKNISEKDINDYVIKNYPLISKDVYGDLKEETFDKIKLIEKWILHLERYLELIEEKLYKERLEKEKLRLEKERVEKERLERERLEKEKLRLEKERVEKERVEKERVEKERVEKERLEKERLEKERLEKERLKKEILEKERLKKEGLEKQNLEKVKIEIERKNAINKAEEQTKLDLLHKNKISDLTKKVGKEKFDIENSISIIKYTSFSGKLGIVIIFLFASNFIGGNIKLSDWVSIIILLLGLFLFIMDFRHNKKIAIKSIEREYQKQKELIEREYQKQKELVEREYQKQKELIERRYQK